MSHIRDLFASDLTVFGFEFRDLPAKTSQSQSVASGLGEPRREADAFLLRDAARLTEGALVHRGGELASRHGRNLTTAVGRKQERFVKGAVRIMDREAQERSVRPAPTSSPPRRPRGKPRTPIVLDAPILVPMTADEEQRAVNVLAELLDAHLEQKGKKLPFRR